MGAVGIERTEEVAVDAASVGSLASELDVLGSGLAEQLDALGALRALIPVSNLSTDSKEARGRLTLRFGSSMALYHSSASGLVERMTSVLPSLYFLV